MPLKCSSYQKKGVIAGVTLDRPHVLNALNKKLWREILENLDRAETDNETRAVIITGSGKAFSAGDDIKEVASLEDPEKIKAFFLNFAVPTIMKIVEFPKPIIAAVNGLAYGGGCEIAMLCDIVVASESATFAVPEALIGAIPPIATMIGSDLIGRLNISTMMLTGRSVTANEAKHMGLVNKVVADEELEAVAEEYAKSTMRAAPSSIRVIKKLLYRRFRREEIEQAVEELINIVESGEGQEGHRAFVEKRLPKWVKP
jgi:enoyl-CoA hydratase/3-hydroxyacyl-CoA dehydrogenase